MSTPPLRILEAALVLGTALFSLAFYGVHSSKTLAPSPKDEEALRARMVQWAGVADAASNEWALPGDTGQAAVVDPPWAERPRLWHLPLPVFPAVKSSDPGDFRGFQEIFLISLDGLPGRGAGGMRTILEAGGFAAEGETEHFGRYSLTRMRNKAPGQRTFRASAQLSEARLFNPATGKDCRREGTSHVCRTAQDGNALTVKATVREIGFKPFRCIDFMTLWNEPNAAEFTNVDLGREFRVVAGPVGSANFRLQPSRKPVTFRVSVDGKPAAQWTWEPGLQGEKRLSVDSETFGAGPHALRFEVEGDGRHPTGFCFDAEAWR